MLDYRLWSENTWVLCSISSSNNLMIVTSSTKPISGADGDSWLHHKTIRLVEVR